MIFLLFSLFAATTILQHRYVSNELFFLSQLIWIYSHRKKVHLHELKCELGCFSFNSWFSRVNEVMWELHIYISVCICSLLMNVDDSMGKPWKPQTFHSSTPPQREERNAGNFERLVNVCSCHAVECRAFHPKPPTTTLHIFRSVKKRKIRGEKLAFSTHNSRKTSHTKCVACKCSLARSRLITHKTQNLPKPKRWTEQQSLGVRICMHCGSMQIFCGIRQFQLRFHVTHLSSHGAMTFPAVEWESIASREREKVNKSSSAGISIAQSRFHHLSKTWQTLYYIIRAAKMQTINFIILITQFKKLKWQAGKVKCIIKQEFSRKIEIKILRT